MSSTVHRPPPGTPAWHEAVVRLHRALRARPYRLPQRIPIGVYAIALPLVLLNMCSFAVRGRRLTKISASSVHRVLRRLRSPEEDRLLSFFFLAEPLPLERGRGLLRELPGAPDEGELMDAGVVETTHRGQLRLRLRFVPSGNLLIVADPLDRTIADFTYIGGDSLNLAERLRQENPSRRFKHALDLCCGTGVQGLTVAQFADEVTGTDINPRAVAYANLNVDLHHMSERVHFSVGDLAQGLEGPYDLVVANPPFVFMTAEEGKTNRDGYGGELGLEIVERILADLNRLLGPDGEARLISNSPIIKGESSLKTLTERVLSGTGLGATLTAVQYVGDRKRASVHRARGISHIVHYYIHVSRRLVGVRVIELPLMPRLAGAAYARMINWSYGRHPGTAMLVPF